MRLPPLAETACDPQASARLQEADWLPTPAGSGTLILADQQEIQRRGQEQDEPRSLLTTRPTELAGLRERINRSRRLTGSLQAEGLATRNP